MNTRGVRPQEMNVYSYVGNDPVNMVDPSGEAAISAQGDIMGFLGFRGVSNNVGAVLSVDLNPFSRTFLNTEIGSVGTHVQKFGVGLAISAEIGIGVSFGNSSIKELSGESFGISGGVGVSQVGGAGASLSYSGGVLGGAIGLKGPGVAGYGSFDIGNSTVLSDKNLFKGVDLFEGFREYFNNTSSATTATPENGLK